MGMKRELPLRYLLSVFRGYKTRFILYVHGWFYAHSSEDEDNLYMPSSRMRKLANSTSEDGSRRVIIGHDLCASGSNSSDANSDVTLRFTRDAYVMGQVCVECSGTLRVGQREDSVRSWIIRWTHTYLGIIATSWGGKPSLASVIHHLSSHKSLNPHQSNNPLTSGSPPY